MSKATTDESEWVTTSPANAQDIARRHRTWAKTKAQKDRERIEGEAQRDKNASKKKKAVSFAPDIQQIKLVESTQKQKPAERKPRTSSVHVSNPIKNVSERRFDSSVNTVNSFYSYQKALEDPSASNASVSTPQKSATVTMSKAASSKMERVLIVDTETPPITEEAVPMVHRELPTLPAPDAGNSSPNPKVIATSIGVMVEDDEWEEETDSPAFPVEQQKSQSRQQLSQTNSGIRRKRYSSAIKGHASPVIIFPQTTTTVNAASVSKIEIKQASALAISGAKFRQKMMEKLEISRKSIAVGAKESRAKLKQFVGTLGSKKGDGHNPFGQKDKTVPEKVVSDEIVGAYLETDAKTLRQTPSPVVAPGSGQPVMVERPIRSTSMKVSTLPLEGHSSPVLPPSPIHFPTAAARSAASGGEKLPRPRIAPVHAPFLPSSRVEPAEPRAVPAAPTATTISNSPVHRLQPRKLPEIPVISPPAANVNQNGGSSPSSPFAHKAIVYQSGGSSPSSAFPPNANMAMNVGVSSTFSPSPRAASLKRPGVKEPAIQTVPADVQKPMAVQILPTQTPEQIPNDAAPPRTPRTRSLANLRVHPQSAAAKLGLDAKAQKVFHNIKDRVKTGTETIIGNVRRKVIIRADGSQHIVEEDIYAMYSTDDADVFRGNEPLVDNDRQDQHAAAVVVVEAPQEASVATEDVSAVIHTPPAPIGKDSEMRAADSETLPSAKPDAVIAVAAEEVQASDRKEGKKEEETVADPAKPPASGGIMRWLFGGPKSDAATDPAKAETTKTEPVTAEISSESPVIPSRQESKNLVL
ncbi:hypothetical protein BJ741DRAFT_644283 [Chytriomyces cf. hyalinus JEL632]|nr:hypothetical protein BJ741DRAFT_644283 [Chytriomyces cf. hyalinus JEL632]